MKVKKKFCAAVGILALACTVLSGTALAFSFKTFENEETVAVLAEEATFVDSEIGIRYKKGTELVIPQEMVVAYGGKTYTAHSPALIFPDGMATSQSKVYLSMAGNYTLVYTFQMGNVALQAVKEFSVFETIYEVSSLNSQMTYTNENSLKVILADGDTFYYNQPVDLTSDYDKTIIDWAITKMVHDTNKSEIDASIIDVRLTDCYDESNYITIRTHRTGLTSTYIRAFANGQQETSLGSVDETKKSGNFLWKGGYYGTGKDVNGEEWGKDRLGKYQLYYGSGERAYGCSIRNGNYKLKFKSLENIVSVESANPANETEWVTDLDNVDIYGDNLFKGFTTGEVYLSISASGYNQDTLEMQIYSLFEQDVIPNRENDDVTPPEITVDYTPTENNGVYVAKGKPVALFDATATDLNLSGKLRTAVYYNYGQADFQYKVPVVNGVFVPNDLGVYTLLYYASDIFGNTTTVEIPLYSVVAESGLKLVSDKIEQATYLQYTTLPDYSFAQVNQDMPIDLKIVAKSEHDFQEINPETKRFIPLYEEEYQIVYTYSDNVYSGTFEYTVQVVKGSETSYEILSNVILPRYFIKGMTYSLPDIPVLNTDGVEQKASCALSYDGGATYTDVDRESATITGDGSAIVKYYYEGKFVLSEPIKIIDVNYNSDDFENNPFLAKNYFQGDYTAIIDKDPVTGVEYLNRPIVYRSNQTSGENTLEFINSVSSSNFVLAMKIPQETANFSGVRITLRDYYDRTNSIYWEYELVDGILHFSANGGWKYRIGGTLAGNSLSVVYNASRNVVEANGVEASSPLNFTGDKCFFDVTLFGIDGPADISITQINTQTFSSLAGDFAKPDMFYNAVSGRRSLGEEITVYTCEASDVLSTVLDGDCLVSVRDPDGALVKSDGITLNNVSALREYRVKLEKYGQYRITYQVIDNSGNITTSVILVYVEDCKAPVVSFVDGSTNGGVLTMSQGQTHLIKALALQDDVSASENIKVVMSVFGPSYRFVDVKDGAFELTEKGTYTVVYDCYDEAGNMTCVSYRVNVV